MVFWYRASRRYNKKMVTYLSSLVRAASRSFCSSSSFRLCWNSSNFTKPTLLFLRDSSMESFWPTKRWVEGRAFSVSLMRVCFWRSNSSRAWRRCFTRASSLRPSILLEAMASVLGWAGVTNCHRKTTFKDSGVGQSRDLHTNFLLLRVKPKYLRLKMVHILGVQLRDHCLARVRAMFISSSFQTHRAIDCNRLLSFSFMALAWRLPTACVRGCKFTTVQKWKTWHLFKSPLSLLSCLLLRQHHHFPDIP